MVLATTTLFGWSFLVSLLHVPNGYSLDFDRDPPRYAAPVDYRGRVSIDLLRGEMLGGGTLSLRFDGEDRTLQGGASAVRIRLKWEF